MAVLSISLQKKGLGPLGVNEMKVMGSFSLQGACGQLCIFYSKINFEVLYLTPKCLNFDSLATKIF
jgi:hypothetical protein